MTSGPDKITIDTLPSSVDEFATLRESLEGTPEGTAALFVAAALMLESAPDAGKTCLFDILGPQYMVGPGKPKPSAKRLIERLTGNKSLARSYVVGTTPGEGYTLPSPPLAVSTSRNPYSEMAPDRIKVFVACSGADSDRPIQLVKVEEGRWLVAEASSLTTGIRSS